MISGFQGSVGTPEYYPMPTCEHKEIYLICAVTSHPGELILTCTNCTKGWRVPATWFLPYSRPIKVVSLGYRYTS